MGDRVRYLAFLLDDLSRCSLLDWVRELGGEGANEERWVVSADHCTIAHAPTPPSSRTQSRREQRERSSSRNAR
jgi:hypothetical protein